MSYLPTCPGVSITEEYPGFPIYTVTTEEATARVSVYGAQVLSWHPKGQKPVIYLSPRAFFEEGKAIRGGIPICWPWFGEHPDNPALPFHGFARTTLWEVMDCEALGKEVVLTLRLPRTPESKKLFPHEFELTTTISVGPQLAVSLKTRNLDSKPFQITSALHSYLAVADIERVQIDGLINATYLDRVGEPAERDQETPLKIDQEIDRIYKSMASHLVRDLSNHRSIFVDKAGSRTTVVWNPWKKRSQEIHDLPDNDYREFLCVETANAWNDSPTVRPNMSHTLTTTIGLRPLG